MPEFDDISQVKFLLQVLSGEFKADMAFKCHLCKKVYMNNIEFMKHLSLHVETDRASAVDLVTNKNDFKTIRTSKQ